jgi:hypothetical protein
MNIMSVVVKDAEDITSTGTKYTIIHGDFDGNIVMEIGLVRTDGVRETPHATRKYFERDGEVSFITYPHC